MAIKNQLLKLTLAGLSLLLSACATELKDTDQAQAFIKKMSAEHQFSQAELNALFSKVKINDDIIKRISSPAEALPWYKYRKIFMTDTRINQGVDFWRKNAQALTAAEQKFGVPPEIIVAIIGVESMYGQRTGNFKVIDALSTLAFGYPARSVFFASELEHFLILCKDEKLDPLQPAGSYAGAMGAPQFMPSSFRNFAQDYDQDGRRDIWKNDGDVIFSVGNYFAKHQWQNGQAIAFEVTAKGDLYKSALTKELKPDATISDLETLQITNLPQLAPETRLKLLAFEQENGHYLIAALNNFYVITRYNHSPLYALAVLQLSQALKQKITSPYE